MLFRILDVLEAQAGSISSAWMTGGASCRGGGLSQQRPLGFSGWGALSHALSLLQFVDLFQDCSLGCTLKPTTKILCAGIVWASQMALKNPPANAGNLKDAVLIPGSGRSPGAGHGNPLQYSCLENPMERGTWWVTFHAVTKSQRLQKRLSTHHAHTHTHT